jgi:periplasmic divalent cation tolerance protein
VPSEDCATRIADALVDESLAASVNTIPDVHSLYTWQGDRCHADEVLLLVKTRTELFDRVASVVRGQHPYEVPGIIALPILLGDVSYLDWIDRTVAPALKP